MSQYLTEDQLRMFLDAIKSDKELTPVIFTSQPTDPELRIRKEVMRDIEDLFDALCKHSDEYLLDHTTILVTRIKDRLNLLWGDND